MKPRRVYHNGLVKRPKKDGTRTRRDVEMLGATKEKDGRAYITGLEDNLLDVHNFVDRNRIRIMELEWIDGYDLSRLLTDQMIDRTREHVSMRRWEYLNNVIVTAGPGSVLRSP